ncbi:MAG: trigger factor [Gammaproteobacteria bacterium]|nr:trigger factor [Gammaproteobacteria bacterium]MCP5426239.1 trigger factor [Gammaproteobacteria bacterium]
MQISVEELDGLKRRVTVQIPAQDIEPKIRDRLVTLSRRLKVNGFRPGKVPVKVAKGMYGVQVREEILEEVMQHSFQEALLQEKLNPVGMPQVERKDNQEGQDLEFSVTFEVVPEFEVQGVEGIPVERPLVQVTESDVDTMIETLRRQNTLWNDVQRPAQTGDQVTIDFDGKQGGEDFPGNKGESVPVILGSGRMLKDFEDALLGLQTGAETQFDITFPDNYGSADIAGKTAHFTVKVHTVAEPVLPELDDEFFAKFDVREGGLDGLRKSVRDNMERELQERIKSQVKSRLMDGLLTANDILLPQALVDAQIEQMAEQMAFPKATKENSEMLAQLKSELLSKEAGRRAALGLIISRMIKANDIQLDESRLRPVLESLASTYEEPEEVIRWYEQHPKAMESVRAVAMEEQVVDWLLERAVVTEKVSSFDEIMKPSQAPANPSESV